MHIEDAVRCTYDALEIGWDGGQHTFCGKLANGATCSIVAEAGIVTINFHSDGSETRAGFSLSYTVVEPGTQSSCIDTGSEFGHIDGDYLIPRPPTAAPDLSCSSSSNVTMPEGTIESPGFSQGDVYNNNMNCQWLIPTPDNMVNQVAIYNTGYFAVTTDIEM